AQDGADMIGTEGGLGSRTHGNAPGVRVPPCVARNAAGGKRDEWRKQRMGEGPQTVVPAKRALASASREPIVTGPGIWVPALGLRPRPGRHVTPTRARCAADR